jgi:type IV fimbrial biogenesis protein FimT
MHLLDPSPAARLPRCRGLSLVEMLVAVGIAAILLTLGLPSLSRLRADWTVRGAAAQVLAGLQLARRTALMTGQSVTLCPTTDGWRCGFPSRHWMLFANVEGGADARREAGEAVLRQWQLDPVVRISGTRGYAAFQPQTSAAATLTFVFCHGAQPQAGRALVVSQTGRPRVSPDRPSTCGDRTDP